MCSCGCGKCGDKARRESLSDDFGYSSYQKANGGYYLADMSADDIRRIAEEEAKGAVTAANLAKLASGDLSPITDVAVATTRRVCTTAVTEEIQPYIPIGILIILGVFFVGRATA